MRVTEQEIAEAQLKAAGWPVNGIDHDPAKSHIFYLANSRNEDELSLSIMPIDKDFFARAAEMPFPAEEVDNFIIDKIISGEKSTKAILAAYVKSQFRRWKNEKTHILIAFTPTGLQAIQLQHEADIIPMNDVAGMLQLLMNQCCDCEDETDLTELFCA